MLREARISIRVSDGLMKKGIWDKKVTPKRSKCSSINITLNKIKIGQIRNELY